MISEQIQYTNKSGWLTSSSEFLDQYQLVIIFSDVSLVTDEKHYTYVHKRYPNADIITVSTAGEIYDTTVLDDSISVVALGFEKTTVKVIELDEGTTMKDCDIGKTMAENLFAEDLKHILVFSDGLNTSGTELIKGIKSSVTKGVGLSGGLAGDNGAFTKTYISLNGVPTDKKNVVMIGLYGDSIEVGCGSFGGWDSFGQKRVVTKSKGNVVYELDNEPILDLYKKYLGNLADDLPISGLRFPLSITTVDSDSSVVRTLLGINEEEKSVTFAGEIDEGSIAELMKANFERVIDGAGKAVERGMKDMKGADVALLVSCIGRKLILKQRTEEEVEVIRSILGENVLITGFYSYGEIGPSEQDVFDCKLQNQAMAVTIINEK